MLDISVLLAQSSLARLAVLRAMSALQLVNSKSLVITANTSHMLVVFAVYLVQMALSV